MKLKNKMILSFLCVGIIPVTIIWSITLYKMSNSIDANYTKQLTFLSENKIIEIKNLYDQMALQVDDIVNGKDTEQAFNDLKKSYYSRPLNNISEKKSELKKYYSSKFTEKFNQASGYKINRDTNEYVDHLSPQAIMAQYDFILKNPSPIGEKINAYVGEEKSEYSDFHKKYHYIFKHFVEEFGYYDAFLIDSKNGEVIYSAFKELDFGVNLKDPINKSSALSELFHKLDSLNQSGALAHSSPILSSKIEKYFQSYDAPAQFLGTAIKNNGKVIGYLCIQVPVSKLDELTTNNKHWLELGLGRTIETVLADPSTSMLLTNSRSYIENNKKFISELDQKQKAVIPYITATKSVALSIKFKSDLLATASSKKQTMKQDFDYMNINSKIIIKSFETLGEKFVIVTKISKEEINESLSAIFWTSLGILIIALIVITFIAINIATKITNPIIQVSESILKFKDGNLAARVNIKSSDEIGIMSEGFDSTMDQMEKIFSSAQVNWDEVAKQKEREIEANKKIQDAFIQAEKEKKDALDSKKNAEIEKEKANEAVKISNKEKEKANEAMFVANQEKEKAGEAMIAANKEKENANLAMKVATTEKEKATEAMNIADLEKSKAEMLSINEKKAAIELQKKVDQILKVVNSASKGDLTQEIEVKGSDAIGQLAEGLRILFAQFSQDFVSIDKMALLLSNQSNNLKNKNSTLSENATSTFDKSILMQSTTESVQNNIKTISKSTIEMKLAVNEISKQASESNSYSNDAVKYVFDVKEIGIKLEENSQDISKFLNVINAISRQTNLLALNATIEAARVGQIGKGFAVVANEVKELAKQTGLAAEEITKKVSNIKENSTQIMSSIIKVSDLMKNINNSSHVVANASNEQLQTTEKLLQLISQSVIGVDEINSGSLSVNQSAQGTSEIVKENSIISVELGETSEKLNNIVKKFKVTH